MSCTSKASKNLFLQLNNRSCQVSFICQRPNWSWGVVSWFPGCKLNLFSNEIIPIGKDLYKTNAKNRVSEDSSWDKEKLDCGPFIGKGQKMEIKYEVTELFHTQTSKIIILLST